MSVAVCRSDMEIDGTALALAEIRVKGGVAMSFEQGHRGTIARSIFEHGGYRALVPKSYDGAEAILINTSGGMAGGDEARFEVCAAEGVVATVTTQAAERIYRSLGPSANVDIDLTVEADAALFWWPQETIFFSGAGLNRRIEANIAGSGRLLIAESMAFGRTAMGERLESGALEDNWRIRRDDRLIFAEAVRLCGPISDLLKRPAIAGGANAVATLLYVAPDAEARLDTARGIVAGAQVDAAVSAWDGMLCARFLARGTKDLRHDIAALAAGLAGRPAPRVWKN